LCYANDSITCQSGLFDMEQDSIGIFIFSYLYEEEEEGIITVSTST